MSCFPTSERNAMQDDYMQSPGHLIEFKISELEKATKHFNPSRKIGESDFGGFYKGSIKLCGKKTYVLIQQFQGRILKDQSDHAWVKELTSNVSGIKHQNLVNLIGYCLSEGVRFVVGECVCLESLSHFLSKKSLYMSWPRRLAVALDAARALAYLHEHQIVLRCFKSSSIVIDKHMEGKLCDYGISRQSPCLPPLVETEMQYGLSSGQLDQYYMSCTKFENLTSTDNVKSFGVILLELITGKPAFDIDRPKDERKLENWVKNSLSGDKTKVQQIIDPKIGSISCKESLEGMVTLSKMCMEKDPEKRPNMSEVFNLLSKIVEEAKSYYNEIGEKQRQQEIEDVKCNNLTEAVMAGSVLVVYIVAGIVKLMIGT